MLKTKILKGTVSGLSDVVKDKVGDRWGKAVQGVYAVVSEGGKSALDAGLQEGATLDKVVDSAVSDSVKGTIDVATFSALDRVVPPGEMPKGLDWSDVNTRTIINSLKEGSPLTEVVTKDAVSEGLINAGKDAFKSYLRRRSTDYR